MTMRRPDEIWLGATKVGEPPGTISFNERLQRLTDKRRRLLNTDKGLRFGDKVIIESYRCTHRMLLMSTEPAIK